ncbi:hypothetical protein BD289DRAFT_194857 [Coniella lustricola]|uniref:Uncharacterized protein n=1 Tax=Coniella lustricola TaxID=2025994 RepID=A0A2T3AM28_9PEZI|nr:hypothetical protein BD289DRAFT_194857 [Coniella lustricola]
MRSWYQIELAGRSLGQRWKNVEPHRGDIWLCALWSRRASDISPGPGPIAMVHPKHRTRPALASDVDSAVARTRRLAWRLARCRCAGNWNLPYVAGWGLRILSSSFGRKHRPLLASITARTTTTALEHWDPNRAAGRKVSSTLLLHVTAAFTIDSQFQLYFNHQTRPPRSSFVSSSRFSKCIMDRDSILRFNDSL